MYGLRRPNLVNVRSLKWPITGGAIHPITPARLSTSEILNFESVKLFRNSGIEAE